MAYEKIQKPESPVYHYTKRENVDGFLRYRRIFRMGDTECWVCGSLSDTLELMRQTVAMEGKPYYKVGGAIGHYPKFVPEDYVILKLTPRFQNGEWVRWNQEVPPNSPPELKSAAHAFSMLKLGFRGDLKFQEDPEIIDASPLFQAESLYANQQRTEEPGMTEPTL